MQNRFRYVNGSSEVVRLAVMMYIRYSRSLRLVEDLPYLPRNSTFSVELVRIRLTPPASLSDFRTVAQMKIFCGSGF